MRGYGNPEGSFIMQRRSTWRPKTGPARSVPAQERPRRRQPMWEPQLRELRLPSASGRAPGIGWAEKWQGWGAAKEGRYRRGIGMSIMTHASGAGGFLLEHSTAIVRLNEDGSATLTVSPCEMGQGILGVLAQIAAESTGVRYEDVRIVTGDTDVTLFDIGTHASRSTYAIGNAVIDAGTKVKEMVLGRPRSLRPLPTSSTPGTGACMWSTIPRSTSPWPGSATPACMSSAWTARA